MNKIIELIKKNFKLLIRHKFSALIILIGPLLIMILAGLAFSNTNQYSINVAVFSEEYNELTNSYIQNLQEKSYYVFKSSTQESCIDSVKEGNFHICIIFPKDFSIGKDNSNEINFYVDYSKINMVYVVIESITSNIYESSSGISVNLTSDILKQIENTELALKGKEELISNLISKNSEIGDSLDDIKESLNNLDLSYNKENFKMSTLSSYSTQLKGSVSEMRSETSKFITDISSDLNDIEEDVKKLNISSSQKNEILGILENINTSLTELSSNSYDIYNQSNTYSSSLTSTIDTINLGLTDIESRLNSAASTKSSLLAKITSSKEKISSTRVSLLDLQNTINNINQGISSISLREASDIVNPTDVKINPIIPEKTHLNYFFPSLLALVIMFVSILLASNLILMEKTSSAHMRNNVTPTKNITFLLSNYLTCLIIMAFQAFILLIISTLFFKVSIDILSSQFFMLVFIALIISTVFIFFGMIIGYIFKSRETSTLGAVSFSTIFFIISDVIVPIESIPRDLLFLTNFNPFMISTHLFRQTILFNAKFSGLVPDIYFILFYMILFFSLTLISLIKFRNTHIIEKLAKKEHDFLAKFKKK